MFTMRRELSTDCASTVRRKGITQGSRRSYLLSRTVLYLLGVSVFLVGVKVMCWTFLSFGVNAVFFRLSILPITVLLFAGLYRELFNIATSEYYVEDGLLVGNRVCVDLWNLTDVGYSAHCVYINGNVLRYIAKPKVFLDALEAEYNRLTGEWFP